MQFPVYESRNSNACAAAQSTGQTLQLYTFFMRYESRSDEGIFLRHSYEHVAK